MQIVLCGTKAGNYKFAAKFICRLCGMHVHVSRDVCMLYSACPTCGCTGACMESDSVDISWKRGN